MSSGLQIKITTHIRDWRPLEKLGGFLTQVIRILCRSNTPSAPFVIPEIVDTGPPSTVDAPGGSSVLPLFSPDFDAHYLKTESSVNAALRYIVDGVVGFDTESVPRKLTAHEQIIDDMVTLVGGSRKAAMLGLHMIELKSPGRFHPSWDTMGLCVVQLSRGRDVWIIHLRLMRALPSELRRILISPDIVKVGVGLVSDITTVWNDLRLELVNLVDVGLMARLLYAHKYSSGAYQNLSLETATAEILACRIDKSEQVSDWKEHLSFAQVQYASLDAIAALHLHRELVALIEAEAVRLRRPIPTAWYSFNSRMGEPTRMKRTIHNEEVAWSVKDCPWFFNGKFQGYYP